MKGEAKIADLTYDEKEGILYVDIAKDVTMTVENLKEHYEAIKIITKGKKHIALVNVKNLYMIDIDAVRFAASGDAIQNRVAAAYYSPPLANRLNIHLLKMVSPQLIPMEIFESKKEAHEWAMSFGNRLE